MGLSLLAVRGTSTVFVLILIVLAYNALLILHVELLQHLMQSSRLGVRASAANA
jgi:hypothetical protein